jgi:hypothetical protein
MDRNEGQLRGHNGMPFERLTPGRPIGRLGVGRPQVFLCDFTSY